MAPSRKGRKKKNPPKQKPPNPLSECPFPHPILVNILSRLPVKTLLRCRSVCKPFRSLIQNPKFIETHLQNYSNTPQNNSFILHTLHPKSYDHFLTLFPKNDKTPQTLAHPFPAYFMLMEVVGSINGIVCICKPPWGDLIFLWNPATRLTKQVYLSDTTQVYLWDTTPDESVHEKVTMGFAYDPVRNDYIIVRVWSCKLELKRPAKVELYSANTSKWKNCPVECPFVFRETSCAVTVRGVPYWAAAMDVVFGFLEVFVFFDIVGEVFRRVSMPDFGMWGETTKCVKLVDLRDKLGVVSFLEALKFVDVWVMEDDGEMESWTKMFRIGQILGMRSLVGCTKDFEIVGKDGEGKIFLYDCETRGVEYLKIGGGAAFEVVAKDGEGKLLVYNCESGDVKYLEIEDEDRSEVVNYNESLVTFKGATSNKKISYVKKLAANPSFSEQFDGWKVW